jgi:hypothetical protein
MTSGGPLGGMELDVVAWTIPVRIMKALGEHNIPL